MEKLIISNNEQIAIQSQYSKQYITKNENQKYYCQGSHPFYYRNAEEKDSKTFKILSENSAENSDPLTFCMEVYLISAQNEYFISNPNGQIFSEKINENENQNDLMKFRKWTILNQTNMISKKTVSVIDNVLFKSPFGHFLKSTEDGLFANSNFIEEACVFNIKNANQFPQENWEIQRPFISQIFLSSECLSVLADDELFFTQVNYSGEFQKRFKFQSIEEAEQFILGELIYSLSSQNGQYIERKFKNNGDSYYVFENCDQFEVSFVQMIKKILPLSELHDKVTLYISLNGGSNKALVNQGLCQALKEIQREFLMILSKIEKEYGDKSLDLQKLWFYLQSPFKKYENLGNIIDEITKKHSPILDILYKLLTTAIDEELYELFRFLIQKSLDPYIIILGNWVQYGIVMDVHKEFFVEENIQLGKSNYLNKKAKFDQNYWDMKYIFIKEKIPVFLRNIGRKIFLIGKYMNVIKVYDPNLEPNFSHQIYENYQFTIHNDELKFNIEDQFKWANQQLIKIVIQKENFMDRIHRIKNFFFLDKGDFFINLMELAEDELKKTAQNVSLDKLQAFVDISIKNSYQNQEEVKDEITCSITSYSTIEMLKVFQIYIQMRKRQNSIFEENLNTNYVMGNKKGYETFGLNLKVTWPLDLILSGKKDNQVIHGVHQLNLNI